MIDFDLIYHLSQAAYIVNFILHLPFRIWILLRLKEKSHPKGHIYYGHKELACLVLKSWKCIE